MEPQDYSEEILNKRFQVLMAVGHNECEGYIRKPYFWNHPEKFSIREARDGVSFEYKKMSHHFKLSKTQLEKLRRAKPGKVVQMTNCYRHYNNWFVILLDEDEEQKIKEMRLRLQEVNKEIKELVGELQAEQKALREAIAAYEKLNIK